MNIVVVGLSHKTANVEIREKLAFSPTQMEKPLQTLLALDGITEGVIVSTCNRVEIYITTRDIAGGIARVKRFLSDYHNFPIDTLEQHIYSLHGEDAIRHVFRVASSLDSMVVGEEAFYPGDAAGDVTGGNIDFDTIAGGDDDPFSNAVKGQEGLERFLHLRRGERQLFPDLYIRCFM